MKGGYTPANQEAVVGTLRERTVYDKKDRGEPTQQLGTGPLSASLPQPV